MLCVYLLFFSLFSTHGQNQPLADSVKLLLSKELSDSTRLYYYKVIAIAESLPAEKLYYAELMIKEANSSHPAFLHSGQLMSGIANRLMGNLDEALGNLLLSVETAEEHNLIKELSDSYGEISSIYYQTEDYSNAILYSDKSIELCLQLRDTISAGLSYLNSSYYYYMQDELDSASSYIEIAREFCKDYEDVMLYLDGNRALIDAKLGNYQKAQDEISRVIEGLESFGDQFAISDYMGQLAQIYLSQNRIKESIEMGTKGLSIAQSGNFIEQSKLLSKTLAEAFVSSGNYRQAYQYLGEYHNLKDSLTNADLIRKLADQRTSFEVGQKQAEVDLLTAEKRTQRIITIAVGAFAFLLIVLAAIIYKYYRSKAKVNRILGEQKAELERLNSTKDKFFSIISHDLRSPVAGFTGISQMIKMMVQTKQTDQLLEMTEHIDSSVDQLSKLLDNLLNWAMQQQGHIPNVPEKLSLKEMADDLVKTLSTMAQGKSIELSSEVPEEIALWSDKNTTMTILRNLVSNALKFTPEGGKVGIRGSEENGAAKIKVYDTGVGMPKDKLKKLFQLHDKKSTYGTSGERGLGLGLQLVHEFMEMNNGKIEVTSEEGKGTTFILWLPLFESVGEKVEN